MTERKKYDFERLQNFCNENNVVLLEDYTNVKLRQKSRIIGVCLTENCGKKFDKSFENLYIRNGYCKDCTNINKLIKQKQTFLNNYGVDNPNKTIEIREKIKKTNLEKYGVENSIQNKEIKNKIMKTMLEKYGVEKPNQNIDIRNKTKKTCLEKYGVENPNQNIDIRNKIKETNFKKYGVKCNLQTEENKNKVKETNLKKYGVTNPFQNEEIKNKIKETNLKKYGVTNPTQNSVIAEKASNNSYQTKEYILPSGIKINYQGYENLALDELIINEKINESDIITGCKNVPELWYNDENNKKRRHYVDIFIPSQNKCIEVKSEWYYKQSETTILLKQKAAKELGYKYKIWVYNNKKEKINCYD